SKLTSFELERLESRFCPSPLAFGAVLVTPSNPLTFAGQTVISVTSGKALVFVSEEPGDVTGGVDTEDIVGIAVTANVRMFCDANIHGDIVTDLNKDGTLSGANHDGSVLLPRANIAALTVNGSVDGQILAGGSIGGSVTTVVNLDGTTTTSF